MVLELLNQLKEKDPTISYRRSCREGVCGSDGMNINGKNGLACITPLSSVIKKNKLDLRPLPGLPVVRDLVVDMTEFYAQYEKIKPFLQNDTPVDIGERLQSPEDRGLNPNEAIGEIKSMLLSNKKNQNIITSDKAG